ncbi:MAG: hypothetical protein COB15_13615 [Flavobacteriales bacterium]|nr:MAG: hypothetical protein COB15_13615 [Flavobacteriales bacterium]
MKRIEIYKSKKKSIMLLIISIAFVALGIWLLLEVDNFTGWRAGNPIFTCELGISSILFFGLGIFVGIKRLIKSEIVLIIDSIGLNANPKKSLTEFIKWGDILGFEEIKIQSRRLLIIDVKNPEYWFEKETNSIRKEMMRFNINYYNSPFNIGPSDLNISSYELNKKLNSYLEKYKTYLEQGNSK